MSSEQPFPQELRAAINAVSQALRPVLNHAVGTIAQAYETLRPTIEYFEQHPEELDRLRRENEALSGIGGCHCLCDLHRDQPNVTCTGQAVPGLTVPRYSEITGRVDVPMCGPCHGVATVTA